MELRERGVEQAKLGARLRGGRVVGEGVERDLIAAAVETEEGEELALPEPSMHEPHGDAMEPGAERVTVAQITEVLEGGDERVLQDVERVVVRAQQARRETEHGGRVTAIEE